MTPSFGTAFDVTRRRARRAYELGRVKLGVLRALVLAAIVAAIAWLSFGRTGASWLPLTILGWTAIEWRGGAVVRGGRVGAVLGLVALALPLSAFRTCCRAGDAMMGMDCCNMTGACAAVGAVLGLTVAVFVARTPRGERVAGATGMGVALLAVASVRCAGLVFGEAFGLLGGLAAGAIASGLVAGVVDRARGTA